MANKAVISLSGGLDSSIITAYASKYYKEKYATRYRFNFSIQFRNFPSEWVYNYTSIINESFFDFIKTNKFADFYNLEYLVKMIENILKIAKFKIDDF